ncbi:MAG: IS110 family transposase, partial [Candidatus Bathyarchaeia archaeon]
CIKDEKGKILKELCLENSCLGAVRLIEALNGIPARAVIEATGNQWIRLHDALEEHSIECLLANPLKTRLIAEARIKTDRLDARILADLLRANLIAESYVPKRKEREWRSLIRHRAALVRMASELKNRIHALLDKYDLKPEYSDLFGKEGIKWLEGLKLEPIDQVILETNLKLLKSLEKQIGTVTKHIASIAFNEANVRLLMTMPGIDFYSAMLIMAEIGDVKRFSNARKLASWAGMVPSIRKSGNQAYTGKITKKGSKWLRWILVRLAKKASICDFRLKNYYERVSKRRGHHKAIVAVAREMLTIIWHMLMNNEPYRGENRSLTEQKLKRMERIIQ